MCGNGSDDLVDVVVVVGEGKQRAAAAAHADGLGDLLFDAVAQLAEFGAEGKCGGFQVVDQDFQQVFCGELGP